MTNILIDKNDIIKNALEKLEDNKKRFLIVLDNENKLYATLTDGDIRRAFLNAFYY